jgi:hypothetical protein
MQWLGPSLLAVAGCFAAGASFYLHRKTGRLKFLALLIASFSFVILNGSLIVQYFYPDRVPSLLTHFLFEGGRLYSIAFVLSALLLFVRESKPEFSRFPVLYAVFPMVIIATYLLTYKADILQDQLLNIYYAGACVAAILIYALYNYRGYNYRTIFVGTIFFLFTYAASLLLTSPYRLTWQIMLGVSILTVFSGYLVTYHNLHKQKT